ncbi:MAG: aminodeoxychorismate/anthranilate synthase component II [Thermoplasmata archaeon]|nr:aminodeoxychorismate/anthranilate synthase component II [Thermoplasmata archaeon]
MSKILLIDNYDSFVYNIAQYLQELGAEVTVHRNDSPEIETCQKDADGFVISPGPGHPRSTNRSLDILRNNGFGRPVLGVCLGHQAIAHVRGGSIIRARQVVHGKVSRITHTHDPLFEGVPENFIATRYHSLIVDRDSLPSSLRILAESDEAEIMALRADGEDIYGVQFHPESVMTSHGKTILSNFLRMCKR